MKPLSAAKLQLLEELIHANAALFHRLRAVGDDIHGENALTAGMRDVLASLRRSGPRTLPQIARARSVSRQYIQAVVSRLRELGLVEVAPNPGDKRASLVSLTAAGRRMLEEMRDREAKLLERLPLKASKKELRAAASILQRVREAFGHPEWAQLIERASEGKEAERGSGGSTPR